MNIFMYLLIAAALIWFVYSRWGTVRGLKELNSVDFQEEIALPRALLIDVREPDEFETGFIPGAINIPLAQMNENSLAEIAEGRSIYLYCQDGLSSKQAARMLLKSGFGKISHLQGGLLKHPRN